MVVERKALLDCLSNVMAGISTSTALEGSEAFIFNEGYVHTYNETISVSCKLPEDCGELSGAIVAKEFFEVLKKFKDNDISIFIKENIWKLRCGNATVELVKIQQAILPIVAKLIPENPEWTALGNEFFECCAMALFSKNSSKIAGVYIYNDIIVSTDEMKINYLHLGKTVGDDVWLDDNAVKAVLKIENIEAIAIGKSWVHFHSKDGVIFSSRKIKGEYPYDFIKKRVSIHMKDSSDIQGTLPAELLSALSRAASFSQNVDSFLALQLTFFESGIKIFTEKTFGKYTEIVPWDTDIGTKIRHPITILVDYKMLSAGISKCNSFYIKKIEYKSGAMSTMVFENQYGVQLIGSLEED